MPSSNDSEALGTRLPKYSTGDAVYFRGREMEVIAVNGPTPQATTYMIQDIYDGSQTECSEAELLSEEPDDDA